MFLDLENKTRVRRSSGKKNNLKKYFGSLSVNKLKQNLSSQKDSAENILYSTTSNPNFPRESFDPISSLQSHPHLLSKIFQFLPGKSLRECASVCKSWYQIVNYFQDSNFKINDYESKIDARREDMLLDPNFLNTNFNVFISPIRNLPRSKNLSALENSKRCLQSMSPLANQLSVPKIHERGLAPTSPLISRNLEIGLQNSTRPNQSPSNSNSRHVGNINANSNLTKQILFTETNPNNQETIPELIQPNGDQIFLNQQPEKFLKNKSTNFVHDKCSENIPQPLFSCSKSRKNSNSSSRQSCQKIQNSCSNENTCTNSNLVDSKNNHFNKFSNNNHTHTHLINQVSCFNSHEVNKKSINDKQIKQELLEEVKASNLVENTTTAHTSLSTKLVSTATTSCSTTKDNQLNKQNTSKNQVLDNYENNVSNIVNMNKVTTE